ncbi:MAG: general L-amino acid transport system permease protein [Gammaproteobacteria bacterium]|jgi:general L-amino acid transport system permease protein
MKRDVIYQVILLAIIFCIAFVIISATQSNLQRLGVDSGIDFFWKRAGFEIGQTLITYDANSSIARAFIVALLNTLLLAFVSIICASVLGLIVGISRLSSNWLVSRLATAYVELFRNIPSLLQIFFWYFVVLRSLPRSQDSLAFFDLFFLNNRGFHFPTLVIEGNGLWLLASIIVALVASIALNFRVKRHRHESASAFPVLTTSVLFVIGLPTLTLMLNGTAWEIPQAGRFGYQGGFVLMPEFISLVIGLSMYHATYISEIVRSSFSSVSRGQTEAAQSLGLSGQQVLRLIVFPQALRVMIPPLTTVYLNLFKGTSLAAALAYPEIISVFVGTVNNLVGQPIIIMTLTMAVYAFISLCIALFLNWYNKKISMTMGIQL